MHSMSTSDSRKIYIKTVCTTIYYTKGQTDGRTDRLTERQTSRPAASHCLQNNCFQRGEDILTKTTTVNFENTTTLNIET